MDDIEYEILEREIGENKMKIELSVKPINEVIDFTFSFASRHSNSQHQLTATIKLLIIDESINTDYADN